MSPPPLTPRHSHAILSLVKCLHSIIDVFCGFSRETAAGSPIINYTRTLHALIVLVIIHMASLRSGNELAKIVDEDLLKLSHVFDSLDAALARFAGDETLRVPFKFLHVLRRLRAWWIRACAPDYPAHENDWQFRPLLDLSSSSLAPEAEIPSLQPTAPSSTSSVARHAASVVDWPTAATADTASSLANTIQHPAASMSLVDPNSVISASHSLGGSSQIANNIQSGTTDILDKLLGLDASYGDPFVPVNMTDEETASLLEELGEHTAMSFLHNYDSDLPSMEYPGL